MKPSGFFVLRNPLLPFDAFRSMTRESLRAAVERPEIREALFVASPKLEASLDVWRKSPDSERGKKVERSLVRYFERMSTRCTPFGLFASCSLGALGSTTQLAVKDDFRRHTRLDKTCVESRKTGTFRANDSLYRAAGRLRYHEARTLKLVAVEENEALRATLERAGTIEELARPLAVDGISLDEARQYIEQLIDAELLVSDAAPETPDLRRLDGRLGNAPADYPEGLIQVDLYRNSEPTLGPDVVKRIADSVRILHRVSSRRDDWTAFMRAFTERYQDREVPIGEVLDEESGIETAGTNAPLLSGLTFPASADTPRVPWGPWQARLLQKLEEGGDEIEIGEKDLALLPEPPPLPDAFAAFGQLHGDRFHLRTVTGPSGMQMLGRFCHLDETLLARVREHIRAEEALRPDAIFAEIVHLPNGRIGNVVERPTMREYEIPYLGRATVPADRQIPISDLLVSVQNGRVVLRSKRLGREVLPRMTNAHNFTTSGLAIYKFLCRLQYQGTASLPGWDWGPFATRRFLPRVVSGRTILAPATWNLFAEDIAAMATGRLEEIRTLRRLPRFVALADGDATLPVDFENPLSVDAFLAVVQNRGAASLVEMEETTGYAHEIVVPFLRRAVEPRPAPSVGVVSHRRRFLPGSEWTYVKLYCGPAMADSVLRDLVAPVARKADRWFFLRYGDPDWHLRVRLHGTSELPRIDERVYRMQVDTYDRELERYGGVEATEISERLFHVDSEAALRLEGERWPLALAGMHSLLEDFGFDDGTKLGIVEKLRDGFRKEFRSKGVLEAQIGQKFRALRESVRLEHPVFAWRSERVRPLVAELREVAPSLESIAASHLHMHANRVLASEHRAQELVLYDFLARIYRSRVAQRSEAGAGSRPPRP